MLFDLEQSRLLVVYCINIVKSLSYTVDSDVISNHQPTFIIAFNANLKRNSPLLQTFRE